MRARGYVAGIVMAGLLTGCADSGEQSSGQQETAVPAVEMAQIIHTEAAADGKYWASPGASGSLATVQVVVLEGSDTFTCNDGAGDTYDTESVHTPVYCASNGTIIFGGNAVRERLYSAVGNQTPKIRAGLWYFVAHEIGHRKQSDGKKDFFRLYAADPIKYELQADCMAGATLAATHPESIPDVTSFLGQLSVKPNHGTAEQRSASFEQGAADGVCKLAA